MKCPECGGASEVHNSRHVEDFIWRRRKCKNCGNRFSSKEVVWEFPTQATRLAAGRKVLITSRLAMRTGKARTAAEARHKLEDRKYDAGIDE